jgi:5-oxoprolinase (ATP-hydrolysing) subunit B
MKISVQPLGEAALLIELSNRVDTAANSRAIALAATLRSRPGVIEAAPGFSSVTIHYDPGRTSHQALGRAVNRIIDQRLKAARPGRLHRLPVIYDGPDLESIADLAELSVAEVIRIHSQFTYRCLLIGPAPGQAGLGPLPAPLQLPGSGPCRTKVPAGAITVDSGQTVIHPLAATGGSYLIGRTSVPIFLPDANPPSTLAVGDRIRFFEVGKEPLPEFAWRM